ncbi:MAG: hypothetical protein HDR88_18490 [Bacteroides sp.]|nr:hypothetical protein [Bacteroides sp.]
MRTWIAALAAIVISGNVTDAKSATDEKPIVAKITDREHGASLEGLSDNGKWAVGYGKSVINETGYSFPVLYNVETGELTKLYTQEEGLTISRMMACDVSDDGEIIAGQYNSCPAIYRQSTGKWVMLPFDDKKWTGGECSSITPDGKYGIGTLEAQERVKATLCYWDLSGDTPVEVTLENLPKPISREGVLNDTYQQIYATELSTDGKSFTGLVMFSFGGWPFIYNMDSQSWISFSYDITEIDDTHYDFTPRTFDGYSIGSGKFLHGTPYLVGSASNGVSQAMYYLDPSDFSISFEERSMGGFTGIDTTGTLYDSDEVQFTARNWIFKTGDYWYDFRDVCKQIWDMDWQNDVTCDEYGLSGTFRVVSDDGKVIIADDYASSPYDSFVIQLPQPLCEVAPHVDLLWSYTETPVNNASFGILKEVKIRFERPIDILGDYNCVQLLDEEGNLVANSINFTQFIDDNQTFVATFRNRRLETGKVYTVVVPAGSVCVSGDKERLNSEIRVNYIGRPNAPVAPVAVAPEPESQISRINASSNPVAVTFDSYISPVESNPGTLMLYRINDNNEREEICQLSGSISDNVLTIFPVMEQLLAKGTTYEVVIEANTLCDMSGADANEEFVIRYQGSYVPEPSVGSTVFSDNFDAGLSSANWMLFDGDENTPNSEVEAWGFYELLPWWVARDDVNDTDMAAVSHSMYTEPAKSDDWLVTKRLFISDPTFTLSFKGQSYRNGYQDKLKIYVYATEDIYTALTNSIVDDIRYYGELVFEETLSPGDNEEKLKDDWKDYLVNLEKFEGQNIYIAFVNDNRNQSAIFIDDVIVSRDAKLSVINLTPQSVLKADEVEVSGIISVESKTETYKGYTINLLDSEGNIVSSLSNPDEELGEGWNLEFVMPDKLEVKVGKINDYVIDVTIGEYNERVEASVMNLAVSTSKKVVIEEFTGQACPNCPLGHAALEWIEQDFPGKVIPLTIHTYPGDSFATPHAQALQEALGLNAAPTARINRGVIANPMEISDKGDYVYRNAGLWYDYVVAELSSFAPADIVIKEVNFNGDEYVVDMDITYALDMENQNVNIFTVVCENGLQGVQVNNRYTYDNPALREWGQGGIYGQPAVAYVYDDVVRTWAGTTFNGTGGFIPSNIESGKNYSATVKVPNISQILNNENTTVTVMLIDAESGHVINADRKDIFYSGIKNVFDEASEIDFDKPVEVYSISGMKVAKSLDSLAPGMYIIRQGRISKKVVIR